MNKKASLLIVLSFFSLAASSKVIDASEAIDRAFGNLLTRAGKSPAVLQSIDSESGIPALYVVENPQGSGFYLLSADDAAAPVLGYSDSGSFDSESIPPQMQWWLSEYGRQIEYMREKGVDTPYTRSDDSRPSISPLMATKWNQNSPYNNYCPEMYGYKTPTGCVATAMAQVMKYWNYPAKAMGSGRVVLPSTGATDVMLLSEKSLEWTQMLDSYSGAYTEEEADAVAYLMKACGYSVNMNYSLNGSGAVTRNAAKALISNFSYNPNLQYCQRDYYPLSEWGNMIYEELKAGRPVLYGGQSTSVGHEFVCDGYSTDGFFHFNWGWGGMSDGYFVLDALNPDAVGTGGGEGGGFNFGQDIIIGVQPEKSGDAVVQLTQWGNLSASIESDKIVFNLSNDGWWVNMGLADIDINLGIEFAPVGDTEGSVRSYTMSWKTVAAPTMNVVNGQTMVSYSGWNGSDLSLPIPRNLADGRYKLTVCTQSRASKNLPWVPVLAASDCYNYVFLTKNGSDYSIESFPFAEANLESSECVSDLYYRCACKLRITVANPSGKEITRGFYPRLYKDDKLQMSGEGIVMTLLPGETITREFVTIFSLESGVSGPTEPTVYQLAYYDPYLSDSNGDYIYELRENVTMAVDAGQLQVTISDFTMPELSWETTTTPVEGQQKVYKVYDKNVIPFSCTVNNQGDFFGFPVTVFIFPADLSGNSIASASMAPIPLLSKDQSAEVHGTLDFSDAESDKMYAAAVFVNRYTWQQKSRLIYFMVMASGVDEVSEDNILRLAYDRSIRTLSVESAQALRSIEIISLDGRRVNVNLSGSENNLTVDMSSYPAGIWIAKIRDITGNTRTLKFMR